MRPLHALPNRPARLHDAAMPDPHCSSCCPVEPPKVEVPGPWPLGALLWLGAILGVGGGAYLLVMWVISSAL